MFYVNDIDGLKFQGPLEKLENWRLVSRKIESQPLDEEKSTFKRPKAPPGGPAIAAYQKIISNNNMVEPLVHVHQIMSSPPKTINPDASLDNAWWMLRDLNIQQVIVTTERKKIIGMLSERDILKRINIIDNKVQLDQELLVENVIKNEFVSTDSISDIRRVAKVLAEFHIDAMPVLEDERLVGIVTRGDILRGFAANPKLNLWT
jgi:acetoin utilization protein AcuB